MRSFSLKDASGEDKEQVDPNSQDDLDIQDSLQHQTERGDDTQLDKLEKVNQGPNNNY